MKVYFEGECCSDCCLYLANGEVPEERSNLESAILANWPDLDKFFLYNGEGYDEFSMSECDCCGSRLGGARYGFVVLTPETEETEETEEKGRQGDRIT